MNREKDNRLGEINVATNGMKMKIIAYRNSQDIDIQFENGEIIKGRSYFNFKNGKICSKVAKRDSRLGETNVATNGMKMKIIAYRNSQDIDIQFENGEIIKGKKYHDFKKGYIRSKLVKSDNGLIKKQRLGEETISNSGMKMKIIAYRSAKDIDVQFEDGTVVKHRWYRCFQTGTIRNPTIYNRLGEQGISRNGMKVEIVKYRSAMDIDVLFEDGYISKHQLYSNFPKKIVYPKEELRVGEKSLANCGMEMTIIAYRCYKDIDVQFEDGYIVKGTTYRYFTEGKIWNPAIPGRGHFKKGNRVGEKSLANCGMEMTIIAYRNYNDIDIQFKDGTVVKHKFYHNFKTGEITNPTIGRLGYKISRVGEKSLANCGMEMTIISYRGYKDIDIQFEDGTIVKHKTYNSFKLGKITNPTTGWLGYKLNRIGEKSIANCGMEMTVIDYRGYKAVDIQFEDGVIVCNKTYQRFKTGNIGHPNVCL